MSINAVLEAVGEFGRSQQRHFALVGAGWAVCSWCTLSAAFISAEPQWQYLNTDRWTQDGALPCADGFSIPNPSHTIRGEFGLVCDDAWKADAIECIFMAASGIGSLCFGHNGLTHTHAD